MEFGAHLHTNPATWQEKIQAAHESGCQRYDGAIKGFGGCPMAEDKLVGNMAMENLISFFNQEQIDLGLDQKEFSQSMLDALKVFPS